MEDLRQIREDNGLRELLPLQQMPLSDAVGDWLRRTVVNKGLDGLETVTSRIVKRGLKYDGIRGYTLDVDVTGIWSEKELTRMT